MRPARILRELDFARYYYYDRTGLYARSKRLGITSLQGATHVIILQPVPLFGSYKIETRLVYWDECSLFFRHELVTLADGCRRALLVSRQHSVGGTITDLLKDLPGTSFNRICPIYIRKWLDAMLITGAKLRQLEYKQFEK
ncbi:Protein THEM6 [Eumeta japonica]|uniref:Protein THEM6 n=1 Tax=Eumeta variegata TaxID=151549 RepID=A0A4C1SQQ5_EUMVA|nr:Protein THEM6 [Eumeta japonica]